MKIVLVTPEPPDSTLGNAITANRWADILRQLGHHASITTEWIHEECDVLIALHARRSNPSIERFRQAHPARPLLVALTGTDLYGDLPAGNAEAHRSLALATRVIALQEGARDELPEDIRRKLVAIYQSAVAPSNPRQPSADHFEVCVLSHLRDVKDPLRAAWAARELPSGSRIRIVHAGRALTPEWEMKAREEERINARYRWLGDQPHDAAMQLLCGARLLVLSSLMEGGASVIAEAVVCGVPILCSNIPGNVGMLGPDYPGYFRVQDTHHLAGLLHRVEADRRFAETLRHHILSYQSRFTPETERASWSRLLATL